MEVVTCLKHTSYFAFFILHIVIYELSINLEKMAETMSELKEQLLVWFAVCNIPIFQVFSFILRCVTANNF